MLLAVCAFADDPILIGFDRIPKAGSAEPVSIQIQNLLPQDVWVKLHAENTRFDGRNGITKALPANSSFEVVATPLDGRWRTGDFVVNASTLVRNFTNFSWGLDPDIYYPWSGERFTTFGPTKLAAMYRNYIYEDADGLLKWHQSEGFGGDIPPLKNWKRLEGGHSHALAQGQDNRLMQFDLSGGNEYPVPDDLGPVEKFAAGDGYSMAVDASGKLRMWGEVAEAARPMPTFTAPIDKIRAFRGHAIVIDTQGKVYLWRLANTNAYGTYGRGPGYKELITGVPTDLPPASDFAVVLHDLYGAGAPISYHAILKDGRIYESRGSVSKISPGDGRKEIVGGTKLYVRSADGKWGDVDRLTVYSENLASEGDRDLDGYQDTELKSYNRTWVDSRNDIFIPNRMTVTPPAGDLIIGSTVPVTVSFDVPPDASPLELTPIAKFTGTGRGFIDREGPPARIVMDGVSKSFVVPVPLRIWRLLEGAYNGQNWTIQRRELAFRAIHNNGFASSTPQSFRIADVASFVIAPETVVAGRRAVGTITLNNVYPVDVTIGLGVEGTGPQTVTFPKTVTVPAGSQSVPVDVRTLGTRETRTVRILTTDYVRPKNPDFFEGFEAVGAPLTVTMPRLTTLGFTPLPKENGSPEQLRGTVSMSAAAVENIRIDLASASPSVTVPEYVVLRKGQYSVSFSARADSVIRPERVSVVASTAETSTTGYVYLSPPSIKSARATPSELVGGTGGPIQVAVELSGYAPEGGLTISVQYPDGHLRGKKCVFIKPGGRRAVFPVRHFKVSETKNSRVTLTLRRIQTSVAVKLLK